MNTITNMLGKEKDLNNLLNLENPPENIDAQFKDHFSNPFYKKTYEWLDAHKTITLHDGYINDLSQKKEINFYNIFFKIDRALIYDQKEEIGYITNSQFKIKSKQSLRILNKKCILNFLIDVENKEIAFLFLNKNQREVVSIQYDHLEFIKGQEHLYSKNKKLKM